MSLFVWPEPATDFVSEVIAPEAYQTGCYFVFKGSDILLRFDTAGQWQPMGHAEAAQFNGTPSKVHYMGRMADMPCFAVETTGLEDETFGGLRSLFGHTDNLTFSLAGRAAQIVDWYRSHQFCGRCGLAAIEHSRDRAMICEACKIHSYPRLSPSIIVLIHRQGEVLLARNQRFPQGMYSTLAGFVEPGESIEETLIREVKEEVGVNVTNLEYHGSQPWPFPNSLMLGFHAEYESGDIVLQEEEIADAQWFDCQQLPMIPGKVAISRWLIDAYLTRLGIPIES
ncbi:NAD(+) diphosphatase [Pseudomonadales bacterium]|nr:NAD(+) diphosphatase [Pseudomonadales bacterium]MDA9064337.1 NAD(+) diphosphatase [Pseudomonadales bacterium]MDA9298414.1 NAD(+) diphosphatase [Pseudomonadales bacterium]MDB9867336.1 NAD(+) diphosphatase [Pseudomonadales bacterium]MDB9916616.1 NAD(+) diphosphatase [Pseudomonadales bacterium]